MRVALGSVWPVAGGMQGLILNLRMMLVRKLLPLVKGASTSEASLLASSLVGAAWERKGVALATLPCWSYTADCAGTQADLPAYRTA